MEDTFGCTSCTAVSLDTAVLKVHKPEKIRQATGPFKKNYSKSQSFGVIIFRYNISVLLMLFFSDLIVIWPLTCLLKCCHLTLALEAVEWSYKPSYPDTLRMSIFRMGRDNRLRRQSMTSSVRQFLSRPLSQVNLCANSLKCIGSSCSQ